MELDKNTIISTKNQYYRALYHNAIKNRKIEVNETLLRHRSVVNTDGPIHAAVEKGSMEDTVLLLSKGANVDAKGKDNITPLHIAAKKGYIDIAKYLLEHGACIHSLTLKGRYTPLHFATISGNIEVVTLLLQYGGEVDSQDKDGKTILYLAIQKRYFQIAEKVLSYRPDVNNQSNRRSLNIAVYGYGEEYKNIVEALLNYGLIICHVDANNPTLLHDAVGKGYLKIVEDLMKNGADVNALLSTPSKNCFTPLHRAVESKQEDMAKLLISYGADINAQDKTGKTPIFYSIKKYDLRITKLLLDNRADIKNNTELLNFAVENGCIEIVEVLLQHGADINATDEIGGTALHYTAAIQSERHLGLLINKDANVQGNIAKLLLSKSANAEVQSKKGETPLHVASYEHNIEVVKVLLEYGAKVDSITDNYLTPLHLAAYEGYQDIIGTLLKFGANTNARDKHGKTALHIASQKGHLEVVETLFEYGADINITDIHGHTPPYKYAVMKYYQLSRKNIESGYACHHLNRNICTCKVTAETLIRHVIKMSTANLYVSEKNLRLVKLWLGKSDFACECEKEIATMKNEKIINSNISFYDILTKVTNLIAIYVRNENIVQVLKGDDYKTKFPIYASIIKSHFRKGIARKEIIEQCNKIVPSSFNSLFELPYECTEEICSYLINEDIKVLMEACKSFSIIHPKDEVIT